MMSLNQIKNKLIAFFESHSMINTILYMDDFDFNAERNITYPVINIEYVESNLATKELRHSFILTIGDLIDENIIRHEDEIFSDSILIADDFFSWLDEQEGFDFTKSARLSKFTDDTHDRAAGITFNFSLSTIRSHNNCQVPVDSIS